MSWLRPPFSGFCLAILFSGSDELPSCWDSELSEEERAGEEDLACTNGSSQWSSLLADGAVIAFG